MTPSSGEDAEVRWERGLVRPQRGFELTSVGARLPFLDPSLCSRTPTELSRGGLGGKQWFLSIFLLAGLFLCRNLSSKVHVNASILYISFSREAVKSLFPDYLLSAFKRELAGSYLKH